jgi:hypothetical protein
MSEPTDTTTELITEHLQYAPLNFISFIDDVINSANAILYPSMDAFEEYLCDTLVPSLPLSSTVFGRRIDGNSIWWWSSVGRIAIPASSLSTANCTFVK